jgi:hypothetical protein
MTKTKEMVLSELVPNSSQINFSVDVFENIILQDIAVHDENIKYKLNRDLTDEFTHYIKGKLKAKEQIKLNVKGETRSGKSLTGFKVTYMITNFYEKPFNTERIVCANQKELRQKLNDCEFGEVFQIDENAFANVGEGSFTEQLQLKDINNIIAKKNIHMIYITPQKFLLNGATLGLSYFGKDTENWVSRFLLYSLKGMPQLLGYVIFDVGALFRDNGCFLYKQLGGCTNPRRIKFDDINKDYLEHSFCIDKTKFDTIDKDYTETCPFYNMCNHGLCQYEHKKDKWIERELKGGLGERQLEKYQIALQLFKELAIIDDNGQIKLDASKRSEIEDKIELKLVNMSNTKFTGVEVKGVIDMVINLNRVDFLEMVLTACEMDIKEFVKEMLNKPKVEKKSIFDLLDDNDKPKPKTEHYKQKSFNLKDFENKD